MLGPFWGLVVIDCDGQEATEKLPLLFAERGELIPHTWVCLTGSGTSAQYWFRVPTWIPEIPTRMLWAVWEPGRHGEGKPGWAKHKEIKLLADRALAMSPPSLHPDTGRRYEWAEGCGPGDLELPAWLPEWILCLPAVQPPAEDVVRPGRAVASLALLPQRAEDGRGYYDRAEVLAKIPDKPGLAIEWGLKPTEPRKEANGFLRCHRALDGIDDVHPSASIKIATGAYWEHPDAPGAIQKTISLFDLGAMLRPDLFTDWRECLEWCAKRFGVPPRHDRTLSPGDAENSGKITDLRRPVKEPSRMEPTDDRKVPGTPHTDPLPLRPTSPYRDLSRCASLGYHRGDLYYLDRDGRTIEIRSRAGIQFTRSEAARLRLKSPV